MFLYSTVSTLKPGGREEGRQWRAGDDVGDVIGTRTDGGDSRDNLAELELVEDGGLTSGIKTDLERPLSLMNLQSSCHGPYHQNTYGRRRH